LRLWCDNTAEGWRASLQPADGSRPVGFADLDELFSFLLRVTGEAPPPEQGKVEKDEG
jgi:hypothetical protein